VLPLLLGPPEGHPGASNRPPEHATATCQPVTGPSTPNRPNRPTTASHAAARAASKSRHRHPCAVGTTQSTPARAATCSNTVRAGPSRPLITRSQPRTVAAGTPNALPIGRCPDPLARAASAAPITSTAYPRRSSTVTGSNTCVNRHPGQRARRGRNTTPMPCTRRGRAHPHGRSPREHPGQSIRPDTNRDSTRAGSPSTVSTDASTHPARPSRDDFHDLSRARAVNV